MRYYCNICKNDISKEEFLYSIKFFDKPLCRVHQDAERRKNSNSIQSPQEDTLIISESLEIDDIIDSEEMNEDKDQLKDKKSLLRKIGGGVAKGVKKIADSSKKRRQVRKWKSAILRRMAMSQLKSLCFERKISTKKTVLRENKQTEELYWKDIDCTKSDLVSRLKSRASLEAIIAFAKRNRINIRDVLVDRDRKKAEWELKNLTEKVKKEGGTLLLELLKTISEFKPMRQYNTEVYYQDSLASFLQSKFPDTKIEVSRGSTRPDIVVKGIAIEVKGPTSVRDLKTIADKCLRYPQYFPRGMICVLFNVNVSKHLYEDWLNGMMMNYPDVKIIRIA